jgi:predicted DNA-binding transcriptional regulator YafY
MPKRILERFKRIDSLIQRRGTGKPVDLAKRIKISESTLYEYLAIMKGLGAPINYDKKKPHIIMLNREISKYFSKKHPLRCHRSNHI